jgi:4-hydroxybenzoyl-CoA reductase subunit beta
VLRLPPFEYRSARSLSEAVAALAGEGAAAGRPVRVVAGGTDLWPNMKRRSQRAEVVIGLLRVPELQGIGNGGPACELRIGATTTLSEIAEAATVRERYPALASAAGSVSSPVLRNMGTLGGNLCLDTRCNYYNQSEEWRRSIDYCMKEAGTICWVAPSSPRCWAVSASDCAPVLCSLGARARLASGAGERVVPVTELYRDDGIEFLTKRPDEIVVEVLLPQSAATGECRSSFRKLRRRGSIDFSVLTIAAAVWLDRGGRVKRAALHLGAVASFPKPVPDAVAALLDRPLGEATIAEAARRCRQAATPLDNTDYAAQWRSRMVEVEARAALAACAGGG